MVRSPLDRHHPAILYPLLLALKQAITAPRLRPGELPPAQMTQRHTLVFVVLGLFFLGGLLLFVLSTGGSPTWLRGWIAIWRWRCGSW